MTNKQIKNTHEKMAYCNAKLPQKKNASAIFWLK